MFLTVDANCWDCYPSRGWSEWFVEVHSFLYIYCHAELFWCIFVFYLCWNCSLGGVSGWDRGFEMPHSETVPIRWPAFRSHLHNYIQQSTRETVMTVVTPVVKVHINWYRNYEQKFYQGVTTCFIIYMYYINQVLCYSKSKSSNWFW